MFTGLIRDIGTIIDVTRPANGDLTARIQTKLAPSDLSLGASIACSGVCLTVTKMEADVFTVQASSETLSKTKLSAWTSGQRLNLEPSLRMGDELGGHMVFGHIDGLADIVSITRDGDSHLIQMRAPEALRKYIAAKGSVSLDGISLTVNAVTDDTFDIMIIPHTWSHTTFADLKVGDHMHIEIDMIARYIERQLQVCA